MSGETEQRTKVLRVATRCLSIDQFVEAFARYCQRRTLYIASMTTRAPGSQSPFVILLADGTQAMRGTCEVIEAWTTPSGPYRRPGVRVKFLQLDFASENVLDRLHKFAPPPPPVPKAPVLPPLPPLRPLTTRSAAAPAPPNASLPSSSLPALPAIPGRGAPRKATMAVAAVPVPTVAPAPMPAPVSMPAPAPVSMPAPAPIPSVALEPQRAPSPQRIATIPPLVDEAEAAPSPSPLHDDDPKTDVDASPDALRAIRASTAARAAAPGSPFQDVGEPPSNEPSDTIPPPLGERTPGSPYILPANPLAAITDDHLRGFVECTLYEETGKFSFDDLLNGSDDADPIAEPPLPPELKPNPRRDQTPVPAAAPVAAATAVEPPAEPPAIIVAPPPPAVESPPVTLPIPAPDASVEIRVRPPAAPPPKPIEWPDNVDAPPAWAQSSPDARLPESAPFAAPPAAAYPGPAPYADPAQPLYQVPAPPPSFHAAVDVDLTPPRNRTLLLAIGLLAAVASVLLVTFLVIRAASQTAPKQAAATPAADAAVVAAVTIDAAPAPAGNGADPRAPDPRPTKPEAEAETETETETENRVGAPPPDPGAPAGDCVLEIVTTPAGARARHDGRTLGETPLTVAMPCGRTRIALSRNRYEDVEKSITLAAGTPGSMRVVLDRPEHTLKLASTPGGATVSIDGRKVGTTPTTVTVPGYQTLRVEMRRAGYRTLRTTHYSKKSGSVLATRLQKGS